MNYSEFRSAEKLMATFKKNDGFVVLLPADLQNKGYDLVLFNNKTSKGVKIQVKGGRSYDASSSEIKRGLGNHSIWHSNIITPKFDGTNTDWFLIHATIPSPNEMIHPKRKAVWKDLFLLIKKDKIRDFIGEYESKTHYTIWLDQNNDGTIRKASSKSGHDKTNFLFENQVEELKKEIS